MLVEPYMLTKIECRELMLNAKHRTVTD